MTPGLISEVPGFERPEEPEQPVAAPPTPIISGVPLMSAPPAPPAPPVPSAPLAPSDSIPIAPPSLDSAIPTDLAPPAPALTPPAPPAPTELETEDLDATRLVARPPRLVLRWDDGTVTTVEASAVIGRDPVGQHGETPAAIVDSSRSLSKTHARFIAGYTPSVEDLHSTNGVLIERAGVPVAVPPGQPVTLRPGDEVVCGTRRLTVEVLA